MNKFFLLLLIPVAFLSCNEEEKKPDDSSNVTFKFKHRYENTDMVISTNNTLTYVNERGNEWNIKTIKYFVSKFVIYKEDGTPYDVNMYKLINPASTNPNYHEYVLSDVPEGRYNRLTFVFGIDTVRNRFPVGLENNSENNSMEWPLNLGGGYHFMQMEGVYKRTQGDLAGYAIHLGKNYNQYYGDFPIDLNIDGANDPQVNIIMNVDQWFNAVNKIDLNDGYGYMMDDDPKQLLFKQNAERVFSVEQ